MKYMNFNVWIRVRDGTPSEDVARALKIILEKAGEASSGPLAFENCSAVHVKDLQTNLLLA